ncbi:hypothetical protein V8F33_005236 [Rhypophila sp. PSN 637]
MDTANLLPSSDQDKFLNVPYEQRWECLKPIITSLYLSKRGPDGKSMTIAQISAFMKTHYSFHAAESQYKRWFSKWGIRKRILTSEKNEIVSILGKRSCPGTTISTVTLGDNKEVDKRQMQRYLKSQLCRHKKEALMRSPGILLSWNLPYKAYIRALGSTPSNHSSPFTTPDSTPSFTNIPSPNSTTPDGESVTTGAPSPTMQLVREKLACDRASLFLQGRARQLLETCDKDDQLTIINYLHDLYLYAFVKAKHWGRGPKVWTPGMVSALTAGPFDVSIPAILSTPHMPTAPTQLCRWSIHISHAQASKRSGTSVESSSLSGQGDQFNIRDPGSWRKWPSEPASKEGDAFATSLAQTVTEQEFSRTQGHELPLSTHLITQSVLQDAETTVADACKTSIMAGNSKLVYSLCRRAAQGSGHHNRDPWKKIYGIFPFHLAATYLDGGHTCCTVLSNLLGSLGCDTLFYHNIDDMGHTVFDTLLINILRSHTKVSPELVSRSFKPPDRFPGEEKDLCGRWDADTPAVRHLLERGHARIPASWKHAFCHTTAQAICHSAITIFGSPVPPEINHDSGLFIRRCTECGLEFRLGPLHSIVVVAFYLASRGMPGETLFGALSVLVCLLSLGVNPTLTKEVSVAQLLNTAMQPGACYHKPMDALDLMQAVPEANVAVWTSECQTGWRCMMEIMKLAKTKGADSTEMLIYPPEDRIGQDGGSDSDHDELDCGSSRLTQEGTKSQYSLVKLQSSSPKLGIIWAAIQTELLTYRRVELGAPWTSEKFSMTALERWLTGKTQDFQTPLLWQDMMNRHSRCGWFINFMNGGLQRYHDSAESDSVCPKAEDVCKKWIVNMDGHGDRARFLAPTGLRNPWMGVRFVYT